MNESAISGIDAAFRRMEAAAHNTANLNTEGARALEISQRDLPAESGVRADVYISDRTPAIIPETIEQIYTPQALRSNLNAFRAQEEMQQEILDLFNKK